MDSSCPAMGGGTTELFRPTNALNDARVDENGYYRARCRREFWSPNGYLPPYLRIDESGGRYFGRPSKPQVDDSR